MVIERYRENHMSDTKDKKTKGELIPFGNNVENNENLSNDIEQSPEQESEENAPDNEEKSKNKWSLHDIPKWVWWFINTSVGVVIFFGVFKGVFAIHDFMRDTRDAIDQMVTQEGINLINLQIASMSEGIKDVIEDYEELDDVVGDLKTEIEITKNEVGHLRQLKAEPKAVTEILKLSQRENIESNDQQMWDGDDIVASDENDVENITADELKDQKSLFLYKEDAQEIVFYGGFSENNRWDGDCILNVYLGDKLQIITEAEYDDGKLIRYRQAYTFTTQLDKEVWCISKRECTEEGNQGDSWNYYKEEDIEKEDDSKDGNEELKIFTVSQVQERVKNNLEGFYHGLTSNGEYNDKTGDAYLVKFSSDGTVRTLYKGNFVDGKFSSTLDINSPSWMIGRKEEKINSKYAYYEGGYDEKGEPVNSDGWEYELEYQDIMKHTSPYFFKCKLKWYGFDNISTL